jgi:hypothetical protein
MVLGRGSQGTDPVGLTYPALSRIVATSMTSQCTLVPSAECLRREVVTMPGRLGPPGSDRNPPLYGCLSRPVVWPTSIKCPSGSRM